MTHRSRTSQTSQALGFGFRCGFLGLLHMEIVRERLEREFDLDLLVTAPTVAYRVETLGGEVVEVHPRELPPERERVDEPYVRASIVVPKGGVGQVMEPATSAAGASTTWSTRHPSACSSCTSFRWPRSCSTSTTS